MDYEKVTVQDCLDMQKMKGQETVLNDGKVEGFNKEQGPLDALIIKDWLTALAETHTRMLDISCFDSEIMTVGPGHGIHIHTGIDIIAEKTGITLKEELCDSEYPYMYSFRYNGTEFFQISKERLMTGVSVNKKEAV